MPAPPPGLHRVGIAGSRPPRTDENTADLRELARACIRRLDVYPPTEPGGSPRIIPEGNLPQVLGFAGVGATSKGDANAAACRDRVVECLVKRHPGAWPLVGCGAKPRRLAWSA